MNRSAIFCVLMLLLATACGKKKDKVLDIEEMAAVMADVHISEAVIDLNSSDFRNDSLRMLLKQSVYAAHGVTKAQVDSSLVWYGYHLEDYMKVYDRTIEILTDRRRNVSTLSGRSLTAEGDSVNLWPFSPRMEFSRKSPVQMLSFNIVADSTWHDRDVLTLSFNVLKAQTPIVSRLVMEYADGSVRFNLSGGVTSGKSEVSVRVDSMQNPVRLSGYILTAPGEREVIRLDSILLTRVREEMHKGYFPNRPFKFGVKDKPLKPAAADSTAVTANADSLINSGSDAASPAHSSDDPASQRPGHRGSASPTERVPVQQNVPYHSDRSSAAGPASTRKSATSPGGRTPASPGGRTPASPGGRPPATAPASNSRSSVAQDAVRQRDEMLRQAQRKSKK